MYIEVISEKIVGRRYINDKNPNVSLARNPSDETLAPLGYARIHPMARPSGDVVTEGDPELRADGKWYQAWNVRAFTQAELDAQYQASIPRSVTKRQAKEALIRQGKYQQALDALEAITDPTEKLISKNYWQESQAFERDNPVLNSLAVEALGMSQSELDDLFIYAATL